MEQEPTFDFLLHEEPLICLEDPAFTLHSEEELKFETEECFEVPRVSMEDLLVHETLSCEPYEENETLAFIRNEEPEYVRALLEQDTRFMTPTFFYLNEPIRSIDAFCSMLKEQIEDYEDVFRAYYFDEEEWTFLTQKLIVPEMVDLSSSPVKQALAVSVAKAYNLPVSHLIFLPFISMHRMHVFCVCEETKNYFFAARIA